MPVIILWGNINILQSTRKTSLHPRIIQWRLHGTWISVYWVQTQVLSVMNFEKYRTVNTICTSYFYQKYKSTHFGLVNCCTSKTCNCIFSPITIYILVIYLPFFSITIIAFQTVPIFRVPPSKSRCPLDRVTTSHLYNKKWIGSSEQRFF